MYDSILVPTDGSLGATHVALEAIGLAQQSDATIYVLHVVDKPGHLPVGESRRRLLRSEASKRSDASKRSPGCTTST